jgi:hypothetical protein
LNVIDSRLLVISVRPILLGCNNQVFSQVHFIGLLDKGFKVGPVEHLNPTVRQDEMILNIFTLLQTNVHFPGCLVSADFHLIAFFTATGPVFPVRINIDNIQV